MTLSQFIQTKRGYSHLKNTVDYWAFRMFMNPSDLLSSCNERISNIIHEGRKFNDEAHIHRTINVMCRNMAIGEKRLKRSSEIKYDNDMMSKVEVLTSYSEYDLKEKLRIVDESIKNRFSNEQKYLIIYDSILIGQSKYEDVAKELDMPINSVKTCVSRIRTYAKQTFGELTF